jgi:hypothetical protein
MNLLFKLLLNYIAACSLLLSSTSCMLRGDETADNPSLSQDEVLNGQLSCVTWKNPELPPNLKPMPKHPDLNTVPEGLTVLTEKHLTQRVVTEGYLDCQKPLIVYVHGWNNDGVAPQIPNLKAWLKKFNVAIYYWHRDAYDPIFPNVAEDNAKKQQPLFTNAVQSLILQMEQKGFNQEIRIVAHSLGSQLVLQPSLKILNKSYTRSTRLEILDPYIRSDFKNIDSSNPSVEKKFADEYSSALLVLSGLNTKTVVYSSAVTEMIGKSLSAVSNFQAMDKDWLGGNLVAKHVKIVDFYFNSLNANVKPIEGYEGKIFPFYAGLNKFPRSKIKIAQLKKNLNSIDVGLMEFKRVERNTCDDEALKWKICF